MIRQVMATSRPINVDNFFIIFPKKIENSFFRENFIRVEYLDIVKCLDIIWTMGKEFEQKVFKTKNGSVLILSVPYFCDSRSLVLLKTKSEAQSIPEAQLVSFQVPF